MINLRKTSALVSVANVIDRMSNLFKKPSLLNDIRDSLHFNTFAFVDVFKGIEIASLLVLDYTDLRHWRLKFKWEQG